MFEILYSKINMKIVRTVLVSIAAILLMTSNLDAKKRPANHNYMWLTARQTMLRFRILTQSGSISRNVRILDSATLLLT